MEGPPGEESEGEGRKRRLFLFLGAGASVAADVPHTIRMLELFRETLGPDPALVSTLTSICERLKVWVSQNPGSRQLDTESVLEALAFLTGSREAGTAFLPDAGDPGGPSKADLEKLRAFFLEFIRNRCLVSLESVRPYYGFRHFLLDNDQVHVFTVNYDVVIEQIAASLSVPYVDGFRLRWDPRVFEKEFDPSPRVALYKLHGSAVWFRSPSLGHLSMPIQSGSVTLIDGTPALPLIMYPAQKWEYERPFFELLGMFSSAMEDPETEWLVVVGYSFRDDHLNRVFRDAATRNPTLKLILISPGADSLYRDVIVSPTFGWRAELGTLSHLPESPLTQRVVRIPFQYERVLEDFGREGFSSIRQAVSAYEDARIRSEKVKDQNWLYIATRLAEEGVIDLLPEVEERISEGAKTDHWKANYYATKAAAMHVLGRGAEASDSWSVVDGILKVWFSTGLVVDLDSGNGRFTIGLLADTNSQPNRVEKGRHALINLPGFMDRFSTLAIRYSRYLDGDPRALWITRRAAMMVRIRDYCERFQAGETIPAYIQERVQDYPVEVGELSRLYEEIKPTKKLELGKLLNESSLPTRPQEEIRQDVVELIHSIESKYLQTRIMDLSN